VKGNGFKTCIHCGTPFSQATRPDSGFCCNGCAYVHRLIQDSGFEHYYDLRDRRITPVSPTALQPRDYGWLETAVAHAESKRNGASAELLLDLEGISCVGCVWLIEKLFREQPGGQRIEINTQYGQVLLRWTPGVFPVIDFAREIQKFGYLFGPAGNRPQQESRRLLGKLGLCGAFALNAMLFTLPRYLGMQPDFSLAPLFELLALLFATLAFLAGGSYFIKRGLQGLQRGVLHVDFPIALGLIVAWSGSIFGWMIGDTRFLYFDFVAIFVFLMLVGRWVQERALETNRHRLLSRNKAPRDVHVVSDDLREETVQSLDQVTAGQRLRILPGEVVPVLAELESREAGFSLEWINGESAMRTLRQGQWVPSGAQNISLEPILVKSRQAWADALLQKLLKGGASDERNHFLESVLKVYLVCVLVIAALGALVWATLLSSPLTALQVLLSVLVVSCPCALGVAYPLAQEWAILQLRGDGLFVRSPTLFQRLAGVRRIIFDKTGTLTLEAPELVDPQPLKALAGKDEAVLREMVKNALHPVSRALREAYLELPRNSATAPGDLVLKEEIGFGIVARSEACGITWTLGRPQWKQDGGPACPRGATCAFRRDGALLAAFRFREAVREGAKEAIARLRKRYPIQILSGDQPEKVKALARQLNLPPETAIGDQTPEEKGAFLEKVEHQGALFVGDGANDSLAFAAARVRGTPATPHGLLQDKADFFFTGRSLTGLLELFTVFRLRQKAVKRAFAFAVGYNVIVVALALSAHMHPLLAAILMPLSSVATISLVALVYHAGKTKLKA